MFLGRCQLLSFWALTQILYLCSLHSVHLPAWEVGWRKGRGRSNAYLAIAQANESSQWRVTASLKSTKDERFESAQLKCQK